MLTRICWRARKRKLGLVDSLGTLPTIFKTSRHKGNLIARPRVICIIQGSELDGPKFHLRDSDHGCLVRFHRIGFGPIWRRQLAQQPVFSVLHAAGAQSGDSGDVPGTALGSTSRGTYVLHVSAADAT